jgi:hypothetical protein
MEGMSKGRYKVWDVISVMLKKDLKMSCMSCKGRNEQWTFRYR